MHASLGWSALLGILLCNACGSDEDPPPTSAFSGDWEMTGDRTTYDCGDGDKPVNRDFSVPYVVRLEAKDASHLHLLELDQSDLDRVLCTYEFTLNGGHAELDGEQSCTSTPVKDGAENTITWHRDSLELSGDTFDEVGDSSQPDVPDCRVHQDSTYTRR